MHTTVIGLDLQLDPDFELQPDLVAADAENHPDSIFGQIRAAFSSSNVVTPLLDVAFSDGESAVTTQFWWVRGCAPVLVLRSSRSITGTAKMNTVVSKTATLDILIEQLRPLGLDVNTVKGILEKIQPGKNQEFSFVSRSLGATESQKGSDCSLADLIMTNPANNGAVGAFVLPHTTADELLKQVIAMSGYRVATTQLVDDVFRWVQEPMGSHGNDYGKAWLQRGHLLSTRLNNLSLAQKLMPFPLEVLKDGIHIEAQPAIPDGTLDQIGSMIRDMVQMRHDKKQGAAEEGRDTANTRAKDEKAEQERIETRQKIEQARIETRNKERQDHFFAWGVGFAAVSLLVSISSLYQSFAILTPDLSQVLVRPGSIWATGFFLGLAGFAGLMTGLAAYQLKRRKTEKADTSAEADRSGQATENQRTEKSSSAASSSVKSAQEPEDFNLVLDFSQAGVKARGREMATGQFRVQEGATARLTELSSISNQITELRADLIARQILEKDGDKLFLRQDFDFTSRAQAARVFLAREASARLWHPTPDSPEVAPDTAPDIEDEVFQQGSQNATAFALGRYSPKDKKMTVFEGRANAFESEDNNEPAKRERAKLLANGTFLAGEESWTLQREVTFDNPTRAACVFRGNNVSGNNEWKRISDNKLLGDIVRETKRKDTISLQLSREAVGMSLLFEGEVQSTGSQSGERFVVDAGSVARFVALDTLPNSAAKRRRELIDTGVLVPREDGSEYVLSEDTSFLDMDEAAKVLRGRRVRGDREWIPDAALPAKTTTPDS